MFAWVDRKKHALCMPKQHGVLVTKEGEEVILFKIAEIVYSVGMYPFRPNEKLDPILDPVSQYSDHFQKVISGRFFSALHSFHIHLNGYAESMANASKDKLRKEIPYHTNYTVLFAESIFYYWALLADDLSRIIPFTIDKSPDGLPENLSRLSISSLKHKVLEEGKLEEFQELFEDLNRENSWWNIVFSPNQGIRHRFTHFADALSLQTKHENGMVYPDPSLWQLENSKLVVQGDFCEILGYSLLDWFNWLDRLDEKLRDILSKRADTEGIEWICDESMSNINLPVMLSDFEREFYLVPKID